MKPEVTSLVFLAWKHAGYEAVSAGDSHIRPAHLLMGLTKVAECDLGKLNLPQDEVESVKQEQAGAIGAFSAVAVSTTQLRRFLRARLRREPAEDRKSETLHRDREAKNAFLVGRLRCAGRPCSCAGLTWALANGQNRVMVQLIGLIQVDLSRIANAAARFLPKLDPLDEAFDRSIAEISYPFNFASGATPWDLWQRRARARGLNDEPILSLGMRVIQECVGKGWNDLLWSELDLENRGDGMIFCGKRDHARCMERWAALLESSGEGSALPRQAI